MSLEATFTKHAFAIIAAVSLAVPAAGAAVPAPAPGDVFAGFRASTGTGSSHSYLVRLGSISTFQAVPAGSSVTLTNLGDVGADLSSSTGTGGFGTDWHTSGNVSWGVFGRFVSPSPSVYGSRARPSAGTASTAWPALNNTGRTGTSNAIGSVIDNLGGYRHLEPTANSTVGAFQPNAAAASSYNYQVTTTGTDFSTVSQWSSIEANFLNGPSGALLDFYVLEGSTVTRLGYFSITSAGVITFTRPSSGPPADLDTDGDGFTDVKEILAGTDPNDATDYFHVSSAEYGATSNTVRFLTVVGRTYTIQYSQTLLTADWQNVGTYTEASAPVLHAFVDEGPARTGAARGFYRVVVSQ